MNIRPLLVASAATFVGCAQLATKIPSVGPDYERPEYTPGNYILPDAGAPTTNLTASGEYIPAQGADDTRVAVSTNLLAQWWKLFDDPTLEGSML